MISDRVQVRAIKDIKAKWAEIYTKNGLVGEFFVLSEDENAVVAKLESHHLEKIKKK